MSKISVIGICGKSYFMNVDHFHENGETLISESMHEEIGGKGFNQAVAAARMGANVCFLFAVGDDDYGRQAEIVSVENKINPVPKRKAGKKTSIAFILTDKNGENLVTEFGNAELSVEDVIEFESEIASSDILLLQHEVPDKINEKAVELAVKHGVRIILNPAPPREINNKIAGNIFAVTPNEHEKKFIDASNFKNCITTLGKKGCNINGITDIPSIPVMTVNTTGAGDTFNGVLTVCIAEGKSMEESCRYAVTASGMSVEKNYVIDSIPYRNEIEERMNLIEKIRVVK